MVTGQDESDPDNHANDKADHETEPGRVLNGAFAQVENAGRLVLVHTLNLHLWPSCTTGGASILDGDPRQLGVVLATRFAIDPKSRLNHDSAPLLP